MDSTIASLAEQAMTMLLASDDPIVDILRRQLNTAIHKPIQFTGVGFFAHYDLAENTPRILGDRSFEIDDVFTDIEGLESGIGFILFIKNGRLTMLEAFTYEEPWPHGLRRFDLKYVGGTKRDLSELRAMPRWPK